MRELLINGLNTTTKYKGKIMFYENRNKSIDVEKTFVGISTSTTVDNVDTKIVSKKSCFSKIKIAHIVEVISPIKLNGRVFDNFAISKDGDLFVCDANGNYSFVEVEISKNSTLPTQVIVEKQKRSLPNIYADTFNVSKPEANSIIKSKHSAFKPRTYHVQ